MLAHLSMKDCDSRCTHFWLVHTRPSSTAKRNSSSACRSRSLTFPSCRHNADRDILFQYLDSRDRTNQTLQQVADYNHCRL